MKNLLIILSFAFYIQSQAQTSNEYLSVCSSIASKYVVISINTDTYYKELIKTKASEAGFNSTFVFDKVNEFELEGWELMNIETQGTGVTCAFMRRTATAKENE